ncbi:hypothetical protein DESPIG_01678 [Desulfovibrio piger ATCC 29098]|uniref:Uncharacterized protein n=1 Tax=Desulfovibrio piger ATCC 29098 TaxID=411464 RepID=B6WUC0_9BACT|nr:hypothetical protein DESPIG_01678 [Desulfovibrio piger ATCC 29098]
MPSQCIRTYEAFQDQWNIWIFLMISQHIKTLATTQKRRPALQQGAFINH